MLLQTARLAFFRRMIVCMARAKHEPWSPAISANLSTLLWRTLRLFLTPAKVLELHCMFLTIWVSFHSALYFTCFLCTYVLFCSYFQAHFAQFQRYANTIVFTWPLLKCYQLDYFLPAFYGGTSLRIRYFIASDKNQ